MKHCNIFLALLLALVCSTALAQSGDNRVIVTSSHDTTRTIFAADRAKTFKITFDSVDVVTVTPVLVEAGSYSLIIKYDFPEGAKTIYSYLYPDSLEPSDWHAEGVKHNYRFTSDASCTDTITNLTPSTTYVIGVYTIDSYGLESFAKIQATTLERPALDPPQIGDILYADGTWSTTLDANRTPIAIIFSTTPSAIDQAHGWTHGYAMALKDAGKAIKWATASGDHQLGDSYYTSDSSYYYQTNKDGYTETMKLINAGKSGSVTFPAAETAVAYTATVPTGTSGWYLPSIGQWYDILVNLGQQSATMHRYNEYLGYWDNTISAALTNINGKLKVAGDGNYDSIISDWTWFWTSSEYSTDRAYYVAFDYEDNGIDLDAYFKTYGFSSNRIRPVIAF